MLEYEWGTPSPSHVVFPSSTSEGVSTHHPTPPLLPYLVPSGSPQTLPYFYGLQHSAHFHPDIDPRAFSSASYPPPPPHPRPNSIISSLELDSAAAGYMMIPKPVPGTNPAFYHGHHHNHPASGIGLNLGLSTGRTYFSPPDEDFVSRLYRRTSGGAGGFGVSGNVPRCQVEGCNADLSHAKHYHRRHKVCDFHSKASTVVVAGITQRFCQQCSRFHLLTEFDNGKRSCRRRLADHNRRRRKANQTQSSQERCPSQNTSSFDHSPRLMTDSVTVAVSPGRMEERRSNSYK